MSENKKLDGRPAYALEKEIVRDEIDECIRTGLGILAGRDQKQIDNFHNTKYLLKQYRKVVYAIHVSEADLNARMEMEHGITLSAMEVNAELAGIDLSGTKLENYARSVIRSKNMLRIINTCLDAVRQDPDDGELHYQVLYVTYFSDRKPVNRVALLIELDRRGFPMSPTTYHKYLNESIRAIDRILWGYTARDCIELVKQFLPE